MTVSANPCTTLIPYRPYFFPIPWKQPGGNFQHEALRPIPQILQPVGHTGPATAPLPGLLLNRKLDEIIQQDKRTRTTALCRPITRPSTVQPHMRPSDTPPCTTPRSPLPTSGSPPQTDAGVRGDLTSANQRKQDTTPNGTGDESLSRPEYPAPHGPIQNASVQLANPKLDQWQVGRRPGHQGTHNLRKDLEEKSGLPRGTKRTLSESISESTDKVLKRPFLPPKVTLKPIKKDPKATDLIDLSVDEPTSSPSPHPYGRIKKSPAPFPMQDQITPAHKTPGSNPKLSQPFKTPSRISVPLKPVLNSRQTPPSSSPQITPISKSSVTLFNRSHAPSPSTVNSKTGRGRTPRPFGLNRSSPTVNLRRTEQSDPQAAAEREEKTKLAALGARLRQLKEASQLLKNEHEEEDLEAVTERWLVAGRDIAERLFDRIPQPETNNAHPSGLQQGYMSDNGQRSGSSWGMQNASNEWCRRGSVAKRMKMDDIDFTEGERAWLKQVNRDAEGNPIDDDGNPLVDDVSEEDVTKLLDSEEVNGSRSSGFVSSHRSTYVDDDVRTEREEGSISDDTARQQAGAESWTIGSMLLGLRVDPALLGWDPDSECWIEGEF